MINYHQFNMGELVRLGIIFDDPDDAKLFIKYIQNRLDTIIGEELIKKLRKDGLPESNISATVKFFENWDKSKPFPAYLSLIKKAQVNLTWDILIQRDQLSGAIINHDIDKASKSVREIGIPQIPCMLLINNGLYTIGDVLKDSTFSTLERNAPEMTFEIKYAILDYLFPDNPSSSDSIVTRYTIDDVFRKHEEEAPEDILRALEQYIRSEAKAYCSGASTLEEFELRVYSPHVAWQLFRMVNHGAIRGVAGHEDEFLEIYLRWKETGMISSEKPLSEYIRQDGDADVTATWFFTVIDALLIPIENFFSPTYFFPELKDDEYPEVIREVTSTEESFCLTQDCLDIDKLLNDPDPVGKSFTFHFINKTTATMTITEANKDYYRGKGIIEGYMSEEGEIEIISDGSFYFRFDKKTYSEIEILMMTNIHPVPHPQWSKYNHAIQFKSQVLKNRYAEIRQDYFKNL